MDDQVGIAADRRGEMGVAGQGEAEMADILRIVLRLGLTAEDHLVNRNLIR